MTLYFQVSGVHASSMRAPPSAFTFTPNMTEVSEMLAFTHHASATFPGPHVRVHLCLTYREPSVSILASSPDPLDAPVNHRLSFSPEPRVVPFNETSYHRVAVASPSGVVLHAPPSMGGSRLAAFDEAHFGDEDVATCERNGAVQ